MRQKIKKQVSLAEFTANYNVSKTDLEQAGYFMVTVKIRDLSTWIRIHTWCEQVIGYDHYYVHNDDFWFDEKKNATLFFLKWT